MKQIRSTRQMAALSARLAGRGTRVGLVPTMGALHEAHGSLIRAAAAENDVVIVSVFVNPLQFGPREDAARYPRRLRRDRILAQEAGADIVFAPTVREMYPRGCATSIEVGPVARRWEGKARPGHFRGVATVVTMLMALTRPTVAYFGQKDYQQWLVIRQLVRDLKVPVQLRLLPTLRERHGLAMSSRNAYLSGPQRTHARALYQSLQLARRRIRSGERQTAPILAAMRAHLRAESGVRVDYVGFADADTLEPLRRLRGRCVVLLAAWVGRARLIDNILVDVP